MSIEERVAPETSENREKPIPLMGLLRDPWLNDEISSLASGFQIPKERIQALIQRESGGNPRARSSTGSRGLMQLTSSVFNDMVIGRNAEWKTVGRGIKEYIDEFRAVSQETLSHLARQPKYEEFARVLTEIKTLDVSDVGRYNILMQKVRTLTETATALGDPYPNLVIGSVYLASIQNRRKSTVESASTWSQKAKEMIRSVFQKAKWASLSLLNEMLVGKAFKKLSQKDLWDFITRVFSHPDQTATFLTLHDYNGDTKKDKNGTEHRIHYALATMISEEQLKKYNSRSTVSDTLHLSA
jgi:hypothetical protein